MMGSFKNVETRRWFVKKARLDFLSASPEGVERRRRETILPGAPIFGKSPL
jgi:hypothetical protein